MTEKLDESQSSRSGMALDMTEVGARLRNIRKHLELTQTEAARLSGTTAKHISEAERGVCGVSLQVLGALCRLYEVSADYILFGQNSHPGKSWLIKAYEQLSPEKQKLFDQQAESLMEGLGKLS